MAAIFGFLMFGCGVPAFFIWAIWKAVRDTKAEKLARMSPPAPPAPAPPPTAQEVADATLNSAARSLLIASVANAVVNKGRK
jgi:hypothetical protein